MSVIRLLCLLMLVFATALGLRLVHPLDLEYKYDQQFLFERSQRVGVSEPWPELGMRSGVGTRNPGFSLWVHPALARLTKARSPAELTLAQVGLNLLAWILLVGVVFWRVQPHRREPWLWAAALAAVNAHQVFYDRVIWQQSVLPLLCVATLYGFLARRTIWGSGLLAFFGLLLGQVHLPGFYFFVALVGVLLIADRRSIRWSGFVVGAGVAILPLIPWLKSVAFSTLLDSTSGGQLEPTNLGGFMPSALLRGEVWVLWFRQVTGTGLDYRFGELVAPFLRGPVVLGLSTHLNLVLQGVGVAVGVYSLWSACRGGLQSLRLRFSTDPAPARTDGRRARNGTSDESLLLASVVLFGVLLTLSGFRLHPHYLLTIFPLGYLAICLPLSLSKAPVTFQFGSPKRTITEGRIALLALVLSQAIGTLMLRQFIHETGGSVRSDHGIVRRG